MLVEVFICANFVHRNTTLEKIAAPLTPNVGSRESPACHIPVCAQNHQQLVGLGNNGGGALAAAPAAQQAVRLAVTVVDRHRVVVAVVREAVSVLQLHKWKGQFDPVPRCQRDGPVTFYVVWVDAGEVWAAKVATYS